MKDKMPRQPKLLFIVNAAWFFLSHRKALALEAQAQGYDVVVASPLDASCAKFADLGLRHVDTKIYRGFSSPIRELKSFISIWRLVRKERPDVMHLITAKPVVHGNLVAKLTTTPTISAISGLGHVFIAETLRTRTLRAIVKRAYRVALHRPNATAIFQNPADKLLFESNQMVWPGNSVLIPGSGADLLAFSPKAERDAPPLVIMPARMLKDKGLYDFIEAAKLLKAQGTKASFMLLGDPDPGNPTSVPVNELRSFHLSHGVEWHAHTHEIAKFLARASIVVLPSYREGLPKTLVDAAAAGRAVVTTDVPGNRDAIIVNQTGLLCRPNDPEDLARAIDRLLSNPAMIVEFGQAARKLAEDRFDLRDVVKTHMSLYDRSRISSNKANRDH